jgi:RNA polymerase subunit RPABC4/transcription elongation factor Spt4
VIFGNDSGTPETPIFVKAVLIFVPGFMLAMLVLLIGYVNGDAKRRGMRYVMWTLLAAFIPNAIGIILYFILRDTLPHACGGCSQMVKAGYAFCPYCGTNLMPGCPVCKRRVEPGWKNCPDCGSSLGAIPTPDGPPLGALGA